MGEHCYVCEDTEPYSDNLERRLQELLLSGACGGLRRVLLELQKGLSKHVAGNNLEVFKDLWKEVDVQVP